MHSNIGIRMKRYEMAYDFVLPPRSCLLIRVDGKSFHTYTKKCEKPFDQNIIDAMEHAAFETAKQMMGFKIAYTQSDECTFLLTDFDKLDTQGWFNYRLNKIISISASTFSTMFNQVTKHGDHAIFDSRAFIVPIDDVPNVFIWRQMDWNRNSLAMLARSHFSQKELFGKSSSQIHDLLHIKGENWASLSPQHKNGTYIFNTGCALEVSHDKFDYEALMNKFNGKGIVYG